MITQSGVHVFPDGAGVPTLEDIAVGLGRQPRFAGHTQVWWPVLLHSLVCLRIARRMELPVRQQIVCLFHDAHECITGDITRYWKTNDMRLHQADLDRRIFGAMGVFMKKEDYHEVDELALMAESAEVGPPGIIEFYNLKPPVPQQDVVQRLLRYAQPQMTSGRRAKGVRLFQNEAVKLLHKFHGCHVEWARTGYNRLYKPV